MKFGLNFFPSFRPEDSTTADYYQQCLRLAARADELGYSSIKTVEHSFYDYGGHSPNPCVFLSAVAARTKRIRLITGAVIPAFHHPAHLGGDLAMLDNMSRGRLDAGFGRAFLPKEFEVYGVPMSESRERFEEAIGMIRRLWTEERVTAKGRYWTLEDVRLMPRVVQKPHPPIWIAAISTEESFVYAAKNGFNLMIVPYAGKPGQLQDFVKMYGRRYACFASCQIRLSEVIFSTVGSIRDSSLESSLPVWWQSNACCGVHRVLVHARISTVSGWPERSGRP